LSTRSVADIEPFDAVKIREFQLGDEPALHAVYHSAIHEVACKDYSAEQIEAWAPESLGLEMIWTNKMREIRPFVVEDGQEGIVAYADLQQNGYIDHFFVSGTRTREGIGTLLMNRIHSVAHEKNIVVLTSHVSRTAQPFFRSFGFSVIEERAPVIRGIIVPNALMRKELR
jgi:putative acetyltransferase